MWDLEDQELKRLQWEEKMQELERLKMEEDLLDERLEKE
jgi:hypothetical protein